VLSTTVALGAFVLTDSIPFSVTAFDLSPALLAMISQLTARTWNQISHRSEHLPIVRPHGRQVSRRV
jgi:hypothetical protein